MRLGPSGNLFAGLDPGAPAEVFETLASAPGLRIERIVSTGQHTPPGVYDDQPQTEWVVVLAGAAELEFADEAAPRRLGPGDYVLIAPHRRHRVARTAAGTPTVWLALHWGEGVGEDGGEEDGDGTASRRPSTSR
ncbi:cupin domain-containing protein [Methylobacterium planeticum]|uniref:cupin domain-containing protein n=1 Tax=Methylobacterium planeticum TaxID=2615211 RepID=UPI001785D854